MTKILAIGNSFSQDATRYLHRIADEDNHDFYVANLYIGGCSLQRHWQNVEEDASAYELEINGESTGTMVSIREMLEEPWDIIVTQQVSHEAGFYETYEPYLSNLLTMIQEKQPQAKLFLQETWAYEIDSQHPCFDKYHHDQSEMYERVHAAYAQALEQHPELSLIPSGTMIQTMRNTPTFDYRNGGLSLCRDGFHMNYTYGRYLLGLVWYRTLKMDE